MLKKLKSLFVIEDGTSSVKKEMGEEVVKDAKVVDDGKSAAPIQVQPVADKKVKGAPGQSKEKFLNVLFGAMEKANLEGFDYLEFKQFLKSLDSVPMDEETKFKSAYATAQTMGTNIEVLRESASHYLNVLSTEGKKFDQAVDNQKKNNLTSKQNEIKELQTIVANKEKQIEALTKDIEGHKKAIDEKSKQITNASEKVAKTERDFRASYDLVVDQIKVDIEKINTYLGSQKATE